MRYILLSVDDAEILAGILNITGLHEQESRLFNRLTKDTGGDFEDIAAQLKKTEICCACEVECQEHTCTAIQTQALGRRLQRLINRAKVPA